MVKMACRPFFTQHDFFSFIYLFPFRIPLKCLPVQLNRFLGGLIAHTWSLFYVRKKIAVQK